ncbi:YybH family protein [Gaetbulibacter aestuarii]|uniref:Nuclear transport factor 2 family protein n=1 Tax=Gaetbulibacter aestuarii TaxID=1502358 RepID=A0ABW7N1V8_9FLAO
MKNINYISIFSLFFMFLACDNGKKEQNIKQWKEEIAQTEKAFSTMAQDKGMNVAFLHFVADDGVLLRNNTLVKGKADIKEYMKNSNSKGLSWEPSFVEVSASGDLGYTYGNYIYKYQDSLGNEKSSKGIFHTVWKRQPDRTWKFVWD